MNLRHRVFTHRSQRSRPELKPKRARRLCFEACEGRIMLAASPLGFRLAWLASAASLIGPRPAGNIAPQAATADLTAYRPQETTGANPYGPFVRTAVPAAEDTDPKLGPGIRVDGDNNNANLIEVTVAVPAGGASYVLQRGGTSGDINNALHVWASPTKGAGQEIVFNTTTNRTNALTLPAGSSQETVWVEWAVPNQGLSTLTLLPASGTGPVASLRFHSFTSITLAIGGETFSSNPPPPNPTYGVWNVGTELYDAGYDVYLANEGYLTADYNEIKNAIQNQGVKQVAIFGYSHGGGDTYTLANELTTAGTTIGNFTIAFTAYVDAIRNNSDFDTQPEALRPTGTLFHVNYYRGSGILSELFLHGVPTQGTVPVGSGAGYQLNVQTTTWGAKATHTGSTGISLLPQVQSGIYTQLVAHVSV